jgi:hypothetical protein
MNQLRNFSAKLLLFISIFLITVSYSTQIYTYLSQDSLYVGDRVHLTVAIVTPPKARIIPPETEEGFGKFVVKEWFDERVERKSSDSLTFKYIVTIYSTEQCTIPPIPFIEDKGEKSDTLYSEMFPMRILSIIVASQPDSGDTIRLRDIKPQQSAGKPSLLWLWIILCVLFVTAAIILGRYYWIKSRKPPPPPPPKPPYEEAIEALSRLEKKQLITKGLFREHVFELSEILKRYMGRRFESNAAEYTTEEMLDWIETRPFKPELCKPMEWFFDITHPVKFAKLMPDKDTVDQLTDEAKMFIEKTKPGREEKREPVTQEK